MYNDQTKTNRKHYPFSVFQTLAFGAIVTGISACQQGPSVETNTYFSLPGGVYPSAQTVSLTLPPLAENVYLTTDTRDPIASPLCAYSGEDITLERATTIKLRYTVQGIQYQQERQYLIEDGSYDSGFTNRAIISTWERFFVKKVYSQFNPPTDADSSLTIYDSEGGAAKLDTKILAYSVFGPPKRGEMTYSFSFFKGIDSEYNEEVMLNSGAIYGYQDSSGGYYTTLTKNGQRLNFSGTYTGWADGDFKMNSDGITVSGYYTVHCIDRGCADVPVTYAMGSRNQLIEISPVPDENTHSCIEAPAPAITTSEEEYVPDDL
jgi:hypothetical protein